MKFIDLLRKLGIYRSGSVSGTYTNATERPTELMMDDVMNAKKDLVTKKDLKKIKKDSKKSGGAFFWIATIWGGFLILLMLVATGFSFWLVLTVAIWFFLLRKIKLSRLVTWKSVGMLFIASVVTAVLMSVASSSNDSGSSDSFSAEQTGEAQFQEKEVADNSPAAQILRDLAKETGVIFGKIEKTEFNWKTKNIELEMVNPRQFRTEEVTDAEREKIKNFFKERGWNDGGQFFRFVAESEKTQTGFAAPQGGQYQSAMCVIDESDNKAVKVQCGFGPGGENK